MNYAADEKTIDLKQLIYYVAKRWKTIFIFLIIGALLGGAFSLVRGQKTLDDLDDDALKELNMEKIVQYASYQELYDLEVEYQQESLILAMDPNAVYNTSRTFYLTLPLEYVNQIADQYYKILSSVDNLQSLIDISGLDCSQRAIKELVGLSFSRVSSTTPWGDWGFTPVHAKLSISAQASTEELGETLLNALNDFVDVLNEQLAAQYSSFTCELLNEYHDFGFDSGIRDAQDSATARLGSYANQLLALDEELTDDDMFYYVWTYNADEIEFSLLKQTIKYAILIGALFCIMAVGCYGVLFLLDDHIKTAHELHDYGLYTIACLKAGDAKKEDWVDRLFAGGKLPENSRNYLLNALKTLCAGQTVIAGDLNDAQTSELMNWLASNMDNLAVTDKLACDEKGLMTAKDSEGAVLFVRLWKTTAFDLNRELYVLRQIERPVKGVVVLRG